MLHVENVATQYNMKIDFCFGNNFLLHKMVIIEEYAAVSAF